LFARFTRETAAPFPEMFAYQLASLWEGRQITEDEFQYVDPDGHRRACLMQCIVEERDGQLDLSLVVLLLRDITTAKSAISARLDDQSVLREILARANILLWWAKVRREGDRLRWKLDVPKQSLDSPLLHLATALDKGGLWDREHVPEFDQLNATADAALLTGAPGYHHQFRVINAEGTHWLNEDVSIHRLNEDEWSLVGVISDITRSHEAEEAQRRSAAHVRSILERTDCMIWQARVTEREGKFDWQFEIPFSGLQERIFGKRAEKNFDGVTGVRTDSLYAGFALPDHAAMTERSHRAFDSGASGYEQEFRLIVGDRTLWLQERVSITHVGPRQWDLVAVTIDITAQREAEEAHRKTEAQLEQILMRADCLLWQARVSLTAEGKLLWSMYLAESVLCRKLFGADRFARRGSVWSDMRVPEFAEMNARSEEAIRANRPGYEQVFRAARDDQVFWLHEHVSIVPDGPAQWNLVGVITDITARRQAEIALDAEKERLSVTLRAMAEGVITTDTRGVVQFMNRAAEALTGFRAAEAVGRRLTEICVLQDARTNEAFEIPVAPVLADGAVIDLPAHTVLVMRGSARYQVAGCCAPVRDAGSKTIGAVLVFRDITERQRLDEELLRASKLESVGLLAGGIAHDFNNILTAIMGNLALALLDANGAPALEQSLREAQVATMRARDLTQQLLTFAKGGDPIRTAVQLPQIVTEVARFALHGSRLGCEFDLPENLWSANADKGQLGQIVQNLVINASQAMPGGGVIRIAARNETIAADPARPLPDGDYVRISVADTGTGIRPEHLEHIFDPYFTTRQHGHGLGLATVYSIVRKHGGHIEVDSELGRGSVFHVWLPALRSRPPAPRAPAVGKQAPLVGRVLFMDDEAPIRKMAAVLITRLGLEVELAADGAEAVQRFKTANDAGRPFDLVVMDLTVPGGMGGREALEELRSIDPGVKAIVSSGYSSDPVLANFRSYGFRGMVAKPYQVDDFMNVLRDVLNDAATA
jgi:PAS domain S-box-containing protein